MHRCILTHQQHTFWLFLFAYKTIQQHPPSFGCISYLCTHKLSQSPFFHLSLHSIDPAYGRSLPYRHIFLFVACPLLLFSIITSLEYMQLHIRITCVNQLNEDDNGFESVCQYMNNIPALIGCEWHHWSHNIACHVSWKIKHADVH